MGSIYNTEFPSYSYASSMVDRRVSKQVHDNVHGNIFLDPLALKFIDTEQFQRLRELKQLAWWHSCTPESRVIFGDSKTWGKAESALSEALDEFGKDLSNYTGKLEDGK